MGLEGFRWVLDCSSRTELLSSSNPGSAAASFASNVRQRCFVVRACSILLVRHLSPLRKFVCWNLQCAPRCVEILSMESSLLGLSVPAGRANALEGFGLRLPFFTLFGRANLPSCMAA